MSSSMERESYMSFEAIIQGVEAELASAWSTVEAAAEHEVQAVVDAMTGVVKQFTPQGIGIVKGLLKEVLFDAGSGNFTMEEIVSRVLNLGSAQGHTFMQGIESAAISALIAALHLSV